MVRERTAERLATRKCKTYGAYTRSILEASSPLGLTHVYTVLHGCICLQTSAKRCAEVNLSNSVIPASGLADTEVPSLSRPESGTQLKSPTMTHGALPGTKEGSVLKKSRLAEGRLGAHTLQMAMLPCGYLNRILVRNSMYTTETGIGISLHKGADMLFIQEMPAIG
ncbi:hypothetical protein BSL78_19356 [Apostichopus japonicus]|uniref:Uncharacterized protein n=1 Tax=Stichopus japonicus TaxID=307972 RepID=A0A2G8K705_STIJA|nr:hypothetical protein BSL78_19356 [Apostichopus japonicus]